MRVHESHGLPSEHCGNLLVGHEHEESGVHTGILFNRHLIQAPCLRMFATWARRAGLNFSRRDFIAPEVAKNVVKLLGAI